MSEAITITMQTPYLTQYLGVWAILESAADLLRDTAAKIDWSVHIAKQIELRSKSAAMPVAASGEQSPTMYSYTLTPDGIAIIDVVGSLMKQESSWSDSTSTVMLRRTIRHAVANDRVRAIMMRYDSPGGTVSGTEELATEVADAAAKKPLAAYADGLMASAAYWLGAQANWIASNETATVGSIGVLAVVQDRSQMAAQQGVKVHVIKSAEAKGAGVPGTEITPKQLAEWQRQIDAMHAVFVEAIAKGRGISTDAAGKLADARVHVGRQAKSAGLVDHIESFDAAMKRLSAMKVPGRVSATIAAADNKIEQGSQTQADGGRSADGSTLAEDAAEDQPSAAGSEAVSTPKEADMGNTAQQQTGATAPAEAKPDAGVASPQTPAANAPATAPATATAPNPAPAAAEPKPASIAELEAAFPGEANASFVLAAAKNAWTMDEAKSAHGVIESRVASRTAAANAEATPKRPGVPATPSAAAEQPAAGNGAAGASAFIERRDQLVKEKGITRAQAVMKIAAEDPALHQAFMQSGGK